MWKPPYLGYRFSWIILVQLYTTDRYKPEYKSLWILISYHTGPDTCTHTYVHTYSCVSAADVCLPVDNTQSNPYGNPSMANPDLERKAYSNAPPSYTSIYGNGGSDSNETGTGNDHTCFTDGVELPPYYCSNDDYSTGQSVYIPPDTLRTSGVDVSTLHVAGLGTVESVTGSHDIRNNQALQEYLNTFHFENVSDGDLLIPVKVKGVYPTGWIPGKNDAVYDIHFTEHAQYRPERNHSFYVVLEGNTAERKAYTRESEDDGCCTIMWLYIYM